MRPHETLINRVADLEGIPRAVAQAMVDTENPQRDPGIVLAEAWGGGSYGLSMVTLRTARALGFAGVPTELRDPFAHLTFGFRYLRKMYERVGRGSWSRAVAAYNAGPDLTPWPAKHVQRFERHLMRWRDRYPFQRPPGLLAGLGGLMAIVLLGAMLPALLRGKR